MAVVDYFAREACLSVVPVHDELLFAVVDVSLREKDVGWSFGLRLNRTRTCLLFSMKVLCRGVFRSMPSRRIYRAVTAECAGVCIMFRFTVKDFFS